MTRLFGRYNRSLLLLAVLALLSSCNSMNKESGLDPDTGKHSSTWITDHPAAYQKDQTVCTQCHGSDLKGGISGVSCFSASFAGISCHPNGRREAGGRSFQ